MPVIFYSNCNFCRRRLQGQKSECGPCERVLQVCHTNRFFFFWLFFWRRFEKKIKKTFLLGLRWSLCQLDNRESRSARAHAEGQNSCITIHAPAIELETRPQAAAEIPKARVPIVVQIDSGSVRSSGQTLKRWIIWSYPQTHSACGNNLLAERFNRVLTWRKVHWRLLHTNLSLLVLSTALSVSQPSDKTSLLTCKSSRPLVMDRVIPETRLASMSDISESNPGSAIEKAVLAVD